MTVLKFSGVLGDRCDLSCWLFGGVFKQEAASTSTPECLPSVTKYQDLLDLSLNHGLCEPSVSWLNFVLWISFSTSFSSGSSTKLAVSCNLHLLDQELSVTCPPSTTSICTRKRPHLFIKHN
ncbi:hypothetical protein ATANTOWER_015601 [Ataeniobius toweri]|uniref:Uncharacterized protein n=1 Tax=Ataeniobius toweri TaxID=208326 RepID=A0ABU7AGF7_9TELE|nr:hypothetical protein [Ataeniobius toweri]